MWFKNLQIYRLTETFSETAESIHEAFQQQAFKPCRGLDTHRVGWVPPLGRHSDQLTHAANGRFMLCMRREDRLLPAAVVREAVQEKVDQITDQQNRDVGRKEKNEIKEEVIVDLLPRAFSKSTLVYAYIDPAHDWIVIDSASANRAEEVLGLIRESLESFKVKPLEVNSAPSSLMSDWVSNAAPHDLQVSDECEMKDPNEKGGVIRMRGVDLHSQEVQQHLKAGKYVSRVSMEWQDRIAFVLTEDLALKRIKFMDLVMEEAADTAADDEVMRFDADFALMAMEFSRFIPALCDHLGGINTD